MRQLTQEEIRCMEANLCAAENWSQVLVADNFNPEYVHDARFSGKCQLGVFEREFDLPGGLKVHSGIYHATLHNVEIGDNCHLYNIHNYIANYRIGHDTCIENINAILVDGVSSFGNGVRVPVMNEGGGREIPIFNELTASLAYVLTLYRHRPKMIANLEKRIDAYAEEHSSTIGPPGGMADRQRHPDQYERQRGHCPSGQRGGRKEPPAPQRRREPLPVL